MSVCVITLGDLCWVFCQLVQGEDESRGQSSEVVWPPVFCPGCLGCGLFPPTLSHSRLREPGSDQDKQLARTSPERDKTAGESDRDKHLAS